MPEILIIDQDKLSRQKIHLILKDSRYNFLSIYESGLGRHALTLFQKIKPSIVILDLTLPDVDGIKFGQELLRLSPQVQIIVLTSIKRFEMVQSTINAGFCGYLLKPISKDQFLHVLERLLTQDQNNHLIDFYKDNESRGDSEKRPIQNAIELIHETFQEEITLHEVANRVFLSDSYFSRLFKAEVGVSFVEYLTRYRVDQGKQLLEKTSYPIQVIANKIGFANASYFTTTFKRMEGITPSEYRETPINYFHESS